MFLKVLLKAPIIINNHKYNDGLFSRIQTITLQTKTKKLNQEKILSKLSLKVLLKMGFEASEFRVCVREINRNRELSVTTIVEWE